MDTSEKVNTGETIETNASNKIEQIVRKIVDASKTIEKNKIKTVKAGTEKYFINCIENLLVESRHKTNPLRKSVTSTRMTGTEQPAKILLPTTEIGGL